MTFDFGDQEFRCGDNELAGGELRRVVESMPGYHSFGWLPRPPSRRTRHKVATGLDFPAVRLLRQERHRHPPPHQVLRQPRPLHWDSGSSSAGSPPSSLGALHRRMAPGPLPNPRHPRHPHPLDPHPTVAPAKPPKLSPCVGTLPPWQEVSTPRKRCARRSGNSSSLDGPSSCRRADQRTGGVRPIVRREIPTARSGLRDRLACLKTRRVGS